MLLPETVPRRNKIALICQIHTEKASKPFLGPFNPARPRLGLSNTQAGENERPRDCNRPCRVPIQHLLHLISNCSFSVFFHFIFSFPQYNLSLSLFLVSDSYSQVELIESFLEIPIFSKKPNKCLPRGKAWLKFQRKSYPGRRFWNGLQDCTAPFNPWLSSSWVMLWVYIPAGALKKEPLCILAMGTTQPTQSWCSVPQMSGGLQPLGVLYALATTQPAFYGNPKSPWLCLSQLKKSLLAEEFVLGFKAVKIQ